MVTTARAVSHVGAWLGVTAAPVRVSARGRTETSVKASLHFSVQVSASHVHVTCESSFQGLSRTGSPHAGSFQNTVQTVEQNSFDIVHLCKE